MRTLGIGVLRLLSIAAGAALVALAIDTAMLRPPADSGDLVRLGLGAGAGVLLLVLQSLLGRERRARREADARADGLERDRKGLEGLLDGLQRDRDMLRAEVELLRPAQELSNVARAHDNLDGFLGRLASVVAKNLAGARELTIWRTAETDDPLLPYAHYRLDAGSELFIEFRPEGSRLLGEQLETGDLSARRLGVRQVIVEPHHTEFHIRAELGYTLPDRTKQPVGEVLLTAPRRDPEADLDRSEASERLKASLARVELDGANVRRALTHAGPERLDSARGVLELACRLGVENDGMGVLTAAFDVAGVDVAERIRVWRPLVANAAQHIAQALRGHGYQVRAVKDGLTGLYNKSFMWDRLTELFAQARTAGADLSLVMVDIDHFKQVNDTWGHPTGDVILKNVAAAMAGAARASDFVFRYGGEEMGFLLSGQNARKALTLANRVRKKVEALENIGEKGDRISVTVSMGVAHLTPDLETPEALLSRADEALYYAKEHGRNQAAAWGAKRMSVRK